MNKPLHHTALQPGYMLNWYEIKDILGQGGFGITYLAHDQNMQTDVAIKEYFPKQWAVRLPDSSIEFSSASHIDDFAWGLDRFISEGRILAKYDHPAIVRILSVFEANNTAYLIMRYETGATFGEVLEHAQGVPEEDLKSLLVPLLDGLRLIHKSKVIHRDIKPDNVFIRSDGSPMLIDFGSARQAIGERQTDLTAVVSTGYAPIEQYSPEEGIQGPWTDIYGLAATTYRAMLGKPPIDALKRSTRLITHNEDPINSVADLLVDKYGYKFLRAIDRALAFKVQDRPQTIDDFIYDLGIEVLLATETDPSKRSEKKVAVKDVDLSTIDTGQWQIDGLKAEAKPQETVDAQKVEKRAGLDTDYKLAVGHGGRAYYVHQFKVMATSKHGLPVSWNWGASLLTACWFMYRKMYLWGLVIYPLIAGALLAAAFLAADTIAPGDIRAQAVGLGAYFLITFLIAGMFGTAIYRKHVLKLVLKSHSLEMKEGERQGWLEDEGGTNAWLPAAVLTAAGAGVGLLVSRIVGV